MTPNVLTNPYADTEYQEEFGSSITAATVTLVTSSQPGVAGIPGIPYKWVRVTLKTEQAARADINLDASLDNTTMITHDGRREWVGPPPGSIQFQPVYRVTSLGVLPRGARSMLQMEIGARELPALLVDGNLRINGNPLITGAAGAAHANGLFEITGDPCAEQYFSSAQGITVTGNPGTGTSCTTGSGGDYRPDDEPIPVPVIRPTTLRPGPGDCPPLPALLGCYILGDDGSVEDSEGVVLKAAGTGNDWKPDGNLLAATWDSGNSRWTVTDNMPQGTYYAEASSIEVAGSPGAPGSAKWVRTGGGFVRAVDGFGNPDDLVAADLPLPLTFLAEGWVNINGNPKMAPAYTVAGVAYAVVAGTDLRISGNPSSYAGYAGYGGLFYAVHQVVFSGNPTINSQVMSLGEADTPYPDPGGLNLVPADAAGFTDLSGNPVINFDGGSGLLGQGIISWRDVRRFNP